MKIETGNKNEMRKKMRGKHPNGNLACIRLEDEKIFYV
jgi:hypothetical protein